MSPTRKVVLDASVGVKWFRDEAGSEEARELLHAHGRGEIQLIVPSLFVYELVAVATRALSAHDAGVLWEHFLTWRLSVVEVGGGLVQDAIETQERLGCSFYDAVAPTLADQMGAQFYSADRRAHGGVQGAVILG